MGFKPGQSGNPEGRRKEQPFATMLRVAIKEAGQAKGTTKLRDVADMLVSEACNGNIQAIKELADRLDGKPAQAVDANVSGGLTMEIVKFAHSNTE